MVSSDEAVSRQREGRIWIRAAAVGLVLALLAFASTGPARQAFDSMMLAVFPHRITMQVAPGNVRVRAGSALGINARLVGGTTDAPAQVEMGDGKAWHTVDMAADKDGRFRLRLDAVTTSFKYRVIAGSVTSPTYTVVVAHPPRVTHIALDYRYPDSLALKSRHEDGRGEIDAPAGTTVQVHVFVDKPAAAGLLALSSGERVVLTAVSEQELSVDLLIAGDNAYRVILAGTDGVRNDGDTEYAIHARQPAEPPSVGHSASGR